MSARFKARRRLWLIERINRIDTGFAAQKPCLEFFDIHIRMYISICNRRYRKCRKIKNHRVEQRVVLSSEWEKFNHATRYRAIMPYKSPSGTYITAWLVTRLTHVPYSRERGVRMNDALREGRNGRGENAFNERKRGSPAVRINDVPRARTYNETEGKRDEEEKRRTA